MKQRDRWLLRRTIVGAPLNGEVDLASAEVRPLLERLERTPLHERASLLHDCLALLPDFDAEAERIAACDPEEPIREGGTEGESDDWPPLTLDSLPDVEPFPVEVLPLPAQHLVTDGADAIGCPTDFLGLFAITMAAGAIGRSANLLLKPGYFVGATVYGAGVGPPSDGKTPSLKAASDAIRAIDDTLADEHGRALERYAEEVARLKAGPEGKKATPPPKPKPRRIDIDDATFEVIPNLLADNPRGLIMIRDELSAFILGMNQCKAGKGNDRSNALKIWSGDRIVKDRVNHENNTPVRSPHPSLTIVGGLTPEMLGELLDPKGRADGFLDRFLLVYPDPLPVPRWSDRGIPDETSAGWKRLILRLWQRPLDVREGRSVPHVVRFSCEGKAEWVRRYNLHAAEMNAPDFDPGLRGHWGKFREYAGRLALILGLMRHAAKLDGDPCAVPEIDARDADGAWQLISYFKGHARRIHVAIGRGPASAESRTAKVIVDWIRDRRIRRFSRRDLGQARRNLKEPELSKGLVFLAERGAIRPVEFAVDCHKPGRPHSPMFDVNPLVID